LLPREREHFPGEDRESMHSTLRNGLFPSGMSLAVSFFFNRSSALAQRRRDGRRYQVTVFYKQL